MPPKKSKDRDFLDQIGKPLTGDERIKVRGAYRVAMPSVSLAAPPSREVSYGLLPYGHPAAPTYEDRPRFGSEAFRRQQVTTPPGEEYLEKSARYRADMRDRAKRLENLEHNRREYAGRNVWPSEEAGEPLTQEEADHLEYLLAKTRGGR